MSEVRVAILTVSDRSSKGERPDIAGPALVEIVTGQSWQVVLTAIVADEMQLIQEILIHWCDTEKIDVILTTGGTGFSQRDVTPEATLAVLARQAPGLAETMRASSLRVTPHAMLSRAVAGIRGRTLIINLPGSPKGAVENLRVVLPVILHAVQLLRDDPAAEAGHASGT